MINPFKKHYSIEVYQNQTGKTYYQVRHCSALGYIFGRPFGEIYVNHFGGMSSRFSTYISFNILEEAHKAIEARKENLKQNTFKKTNTYYV